MATPADRLTHVDAGDDSLRLRAPLSRWVFDFVLLAWTTFVGLSLGDDAAWFVPLLIVVVVAMAVDLRWLGVTATVSTLHIRNWRPRSLPWTRIDALTISAPHGVAGIDVWSDGRRTRLRYPHGSLLGGARRRAQLQEQHQLLVTRWNHARDHRA